MAGEDGCAYKKNKQSDEQWKHLYQRESSALAVTSGFYSIVLNQNHNVRCVND